MLAHSHSALPYISLYLAFFRVFFFVCGSLTWHFDVKASAVVKTIPSSSSADIHTLNKRHWIMMRHKNRSMRLALFSNNIIFFCLQIIWLQLLLSVVCVRLCRLVGRHTNTHCVTASHWCNENFEKLNSQPRAYIQTNNETDTDCMWMRKRTRKKRSLLAECLAPHLLLYAVNSEICCCLLSFFRLLA